MSPPPLPLKVIRYSHRRWFFQNVVLGLPAIAIYVALVPKSREFFLKPQGIALAVGLLALFNWIWKRRQDKGQRMAIFADRVQLVEGASTVTGEVFFKDVSIFKVYSEDIGGTFWARLTGSEDGVGVGVVFANGPGLSHWPSNQLFIGPRIFKSGCDLVLGRYYEQRVPEVVATLNSYLRMHQHGLPAVSL